MTLAFTQDDFDELAGKHQGKYRITYKEDQGFGRTRLPTKSKRWLPAFAADDCQLQAVLLHAAIRYAFRDKPIPLDFVADIETVIKLAKQQSAIRLAAAERSSKQSQQRIYQNLICVQEVGGYVAYNAAIAYRSWRLGWPSTLVARELNVSADTVASVVQMLNDYAEALGFETHRQHPAKGTVKVDVNAIVAMWSQGWTIKQISERTGHCRYRIGLVLKQQNLYKYQKMLPAKVNAILKMWADGYAVNEIRRQLGAGYQITVRIIRDSGGYVPKSKGTGAKKWSSHRKADLVSATASRS